MKSGFIGLGAQKCATTWMYRVLEDHPQARLSQPKELHFFTAHYDRGYRWYDSHFAAGQGATAVGEISTSYLCSAEAPARAAAYNPVFGLLVALRDPVERAYSNHLHEIRAGHIGASDLAFEDALSGNPMYIEQGLYGSHLSRWLQHFPRESLHVVFQEDIQRDPQAQATGLYRFLGLDPTHRSAYEAEVVNASARPRSGSAGRVMKAGAGVVRALAGERFIRDLRVAAPFRYLRHANARDIKLDVPPMQEATRRRLISVFAADMRALAGLLGRHELPWRSWRDAVA